MGEPDGAGPGDTATFEELMEALEALTDQLATGDLGIEQAADLYERAEALHTRARRRLAEVSERIARLGPGASVESPGSGGALDA